MVHGQQAAPALRDQVVHREHAREAEVPEVFEHDFEEDASKCVLRPALAIQPRFGRALLEAAALTRVLPERRAPEPVEQRHKHRLFEVPSHSPERIGRYIAAQQPEPRQVRKHVTTQELRAPTVGHFASPVSPRSAPAAALAAELLAQWREIRGTGAERKGALSWPGTRGWAADGC